MTKLFYILSWCVVFDSEKYVSITICANILWSILIPVTSIDPKCAWSCFGHRIKINACRKKLKIKNSPIIYWIPFAISNMNTIRIGINCIGISISRSCNSWLKCICTSTNRIDDIQWINSIS